MLTFHTSLRLHITTVLHWTISFLSQLVPASSTVTPLSPSAERSSVTSYSNSNKFFVHWSLLIAIETTFTSLWHQITRCCWVTDLSKLSNKTMICQRPSMLMFHHLCLYVPNWRTVNTILLWVKADNLFVPVRGDTQTRFVSELILSETLAGMQVGYSVYVRASSNLSILLYSLLRNQGRAGGSNGRHQKAGQQNTLQIKEWVHFLPFSVARLAAGDYFPIQLSINHFALFTLILIA